MVVRRIFNNLEVAILDIVSREKFSEKQITQLFVKTHNLEVVCGARNNHKLWSKSTTSVAFLAIPGCQTVEYNGVTVGGL